MSACCCSSRTCELMGCQRDAEDRRRLMGQSTPQYPFTVGPIPGVIPYQTTPSSEPAPVPGRTVVLKPLTEDDVRRIVREELRKLVG